VEIGDELPPRAAQDSRGSGAEATGLLEGCFQITNQEVDACNVEVPIFCTGGVLRLQLFPVPACSQIDSPPTQWEQGVAG
jgi:hypothetical protein